MTNIEINLKPEHDIFGNRVGYATLGGRTVRLDIIPPAPLWRGEIPIPDLPPDPEKWSVWVDEEPLCLISQLNDLGDALAQLLTKGAA